MTIKEAIEKLNDILIKGFSDGLTEGKLRNKAIRMGIKALEKQLETRLVEVYPYNLALSIFGTGWNESEERALELSIKGIDAGLATLTDRERIVLEMRFKDRLTLEQVAKSQGVTRERIRQIEAKALRKLRHPARLAKLKAYTFDEVVKHREELNALIEENKLLKKAISLYTKKEIDKEGLEKLAKVADVKSITLEDLDFSIRSYNCLARRGISNLGDLLELTYAELSQVRNMGAKSREEVMRKLAEYNLTLKGWVEE